MARREVEIKMTHKGYVTGRGMSKSGFVLLRETAKFWISEHGFKFRKIDGTEAGVTYPTFTLQLDTIVEK